MSDDDFKIGDRVAIIGEHHPWKGASGTIADPFPPNPVGLVWQVELDPDTRGAYSGQRAGVAESEIRPDRRAAPR